MSLLNYKYQTAVGCEQMWCRQLEGLIQNVVKWLRERRPICGIDHHLNGLTTTDARNAVSRAQSAERWYALGSFMKVLKQFWT